MEQTGKLKMEISETERREVELVMKCADLIKSSIRMSAAMQGAVHMQPQDVIASLTIAVGDFIVGVASSREARKKILKEFTNLLKDYVMNAEKEADN